VRRQCLVEAANMCRNEHAWRGARQWQQVPYPPSPTCAHPSTHLQFPKCRLLLRSQHRPSAAAATAATTRSAPAAQVLAGPAACAAACALARWRRRPRLWVGIVQVSACPLLAVQEVMAVPVQLDVLIGSIQVKWKAELEVQQCAAGSLPLRPGGGRALEGGSTGQAGQQ
jgi:hypothetical protein